MCSFTNSEKPTTPATSPNSASNKANDGDHKRNNSQAADERPAYHTENIGAGPKPQHAPESPAAGPQRTMHTNTGGSSPPRRVGWTAVRTLPSGEESFAKYLDDGTFVAAGSRLAPPPAPEPFKAAEFPTQRDEELMDKGVGLGLHDGKGHGDVVDEVVYKGRGKAQKDVAGEKDVGGVESKGGKAGEKQKTVAGKKKFGSFNAMLYGPPAVDGNNEKR
ncbi:unnamed protein product [Zymoseptoria tritici ST99CH_1E4]|uniref:Uncharacterized protein n=1 Tax=Zymoseptoria tritici ST99CH_1E4 TaxID=1276532 RepID=A0A2H1GQ57_ZYMTR|nr:unnamed protein product [Zymoseptoria tritici ST99CH_1E4]